MKRVTSLAVSILLSLFLSSTLTGQEIVKSPQSVVLDLSGWVKKDSKLGITSYKNNELLMRVKQKGYYYVLVAPDDEENLSDSATVEVTLRNLSGSGTKLGYGLVFHSNPEPLQQGYAFLIDTAKKRYRVVHHEPGTESLVTRWTPSAFIYGGKASNTLKIVDNGVTTDLYINGSKVTSVENRFAFKNGVPGLYADTFDIAFKDLTIIR